MKRVGLLPVIALALLTACGDAGTSDRTAPPGRDIDGAWRLVVGEVDDAPVALVDGWDVTLTVDDRRLGGTAACNGYGGTVAHDPVDGSFAVGELSRTEMACEPAAMELERAFLGHLATATQAWVDDTGGLSLVGPSSTWYFEPLTPVPTEDLVGPTWVLDTVLVGDAATNAPGMESATLTLHPDGTLAGSTGCRRLEGEWIVSGAEVLVTTFAAIDDPTAGRCTPESERLDGTIVSVLGDGFTVEIDGDRLTVTSRGGDGLAYRAP